MNFYNYATLPSLNRLDESVSISVNPNGPASYYFSFDVGVDVSQVLVSVESVESDPELCAILLVEEKERNPVWL